MWIAILGLPLTIVICGSLIEPLHRSVGSGWAATIVLSLIAFSFCFILGASAAYDDGERDFGKIVSYGFAVFKGWVFYVLFFVVVSFALFLFLQL